MPQMPGSQEPNQVSTWGSGPEYLSHHLPLPKASAGRKPESGAEPGLGCRSSNTGCRCVEQHVNGRPSAHPCSLLLADRHGISGCMQLICSLSPEGHLGCFQVLAMMNKASVTFAYRVFCGRKFSAPLGTYQGVGFLDHTVRGCLV